MKLVNKTTQTELAREVELANTFVSRGIGLLGRRGLPAGKTLWIQGSRWVACNSIHTLFMRFAIDAVFVDKNLVVKRVYENLLPWRMTSPAIGAHSVFEFPSGSIRNQNRVKIGDQLHVGD